jgi:antirestriction protein ArdC
MTQDTQPTETPTFTRRSVENELFLQDIAAERGCSCKPYEDWFTYRLWQQQGMQVSRGEKGTHLPKPTLVSVEEETDGGTKTHRFPKTSVVFCRCQVFNARSTRVDPTRYYYARKGAVK